MKYDVFISYSRKDSEIADQISDILQQNNISCFIDREGLSGGEEFSPILADEIANSTIFLYLGSENSYASKWTSKEFHFALNHKEKNAIIPYLIDEAEVSQDIEFLTSDLNVRNKKEHPVDTILVQDIKNALAKLCPSNSKDDKKMAKSIAEIILNSSHSVIENVEMLCSLGDLAFEECTVNIRPLEALTYYDYALKIIKEKDFNFPALPELYKKIADLERGKNDLKSAVSDYKKAIELFNNGYRSKRRHDNTTVECLRSLAEIFYEQKDYKLAEIQCNAAISILQTCDRLLFSVIDNISASVDLQSNIFKAQGKESEAESIYDKVLSSFRSNPNYSKLLVKFAESCFASKKYTKSCEYLKEACNLEPDNVDVLLDLAPVYEKINKEIETENCYDKALKILLNNFGRQNIDTLEETIKKMTSFFSSKGNYAKVNSIYQLAIAKYKVEIFNSTLSEIRLGQLYEWYGRWLLSQNSYKEAESNFQKCLNLVEKQGVSYLGKYRNTIVISTYLSVIYNRLDLKNESISILKDIADKVSNISDINNVRKIRALAEAISIIIEYSYDEGRDSIKNLLVSEFDKMTFDNKEQEASVCTGYGWYLMMLDEYQMSIPSLEKALDLFQTLKKEDAAIANAENNLGRAYIYTGNFEKAESLISSALNYYEKAAEKDSRFIHNYAESLYNNGCLAMEQKKYPLAEKYLSNSIKEYENAKSYGGNFDNEIKEANLKCEKVKFFMK